MSQALPNSKAKLPVMFIIFNKILIIVAGICFASYKKLTYTYATIYYHGFFTIGTNNG
jgi:hypothetical protein